MVVVPEPLVRGSYSASTLLVGATATLGSELAFLMTGICLAATFFVVAAATLRSEIAVALKSYSDAVIPLGFCTISFTYKVWA